MAQELGKEWEDYNPKDWADVPSKEKNILEQGWEFLTEPIKPVQDWANRTSAKFESSNPTWMNNFMSGATQGLASLASPLNIGTAALGGLEFGAMKAGLGSIARLANIGGRVSNIPQAIYGGSEVINNPSLSGKASGLAEIGMAGLGMRGPVTKGNIKPNITEPVSEFVKPIQPEIKPETGILNKPGTAIIIKKPDPNIIKQAMLKGYRFDSIRDDGSFRMVKTDTPMDLPILESEVGQNRPTPKNAKMAAQEPPNLPPEGPIDESAITPERKATVATELINFPRAVMASMDFSAPLRQGVTLIHKKAFWTSLDDMFKAWGSEGAYKQIQKDILERPLFKPRAASNGMQIKSFAEDAGLKLTDLNSLSNREENLMSSWAEKVPGVRRSNRAYTAFLNKLRADTFEDLVNRSKVFGPDAKINLPLARALADFVNTASGRGSLGKLEQSAVALNTVLFSPRLIASRLQMLNPARYIMADPIVRKESLKSLLTVTAVGNTVAQLGKMAGGTVESDPTSSDFGKLKIGNVRLDPYGGFQQYIVAASRLLSGKSTSSTSGKEYDLMHPTKPFDPTYLGTIGRFGQSKLNPIMGFAIALLSGSKEMTGQKMNFTTPNPMENAVAQRFIPIIMQDIYQLAQEDPSLLPIVGGLNMFGMSSQIY